MVILKSSKKEGENKMENTMFKVCELAHVGKRENKEPCGIAYYKKYSDALKDFYFRVERLEELYNKTGETTRQGTYDINYQITCSDEKIRYEFRLEMHYIN